MEEMFLRDFDDNLKLFEAAGDATDVGELDTKWSFIGTMRKKLNNNAKKLQDQIVNKVINKYMPPILEIETNAAKQVAQLAQQNKQPKEVMNIMYRNMGTVAATQQKQIKIIHDAIEKFIEPTQKRFDDKIEKSNMSDRRKNNLKNYWLLLMTQVKMNSFHYISKTIQEEVSKVLGDNKQAKQYVKAADKGGQQVIDKTIQNLKQEETTKKEAVKQADTEEKKNPQPEVKGGKETGEVAKPKPLTSEQEDKLPQPGNTYKYFSKKLNKEVDARIMKNNHMDKGKRYIVYFYSGQQYMVPVEMADKFTKEGSAKPAEKPAEKQPGVPTEQPKTATTETPTTTTPEKTETSAPTETKPSTIDQPETKPEEQNTAKEYKIGSAYRFKTLTPGKKGTLKVLDKSGDQYTVQLGLDPKVAKQEKRSQKWMDQWVTESIEEPNYNLVAESLDDFLKYDALYEA